MQSLKKSFAILGMAALMALGTAVLLPSPALAACTPAATSLDDFIVCDGTVGTFHALAGNDTIIITKNGTVDYLYGDAGNDSITNYGYVDYLFGDAGNDSITNYGYVAFLYGNPGNDSIINYGDVDYIFGGQDNDIIINYGTAAFVLGDEGNDILTNYGTIQYLLGDEGNDIINNYGTVQFLEGDDDNDIITNYGVAQYLYGDEGNDILINYGVIEYLYGGDGDDLIVHNGIVTTAIKAGSEDDHVILGRVFVMSGLIDGEDDFDTLDFDTVGDTRADVRALLQIVAENKGEGTLTWHGATFSWVNFEALTGNVRYRSAVASDGLIRVTETLDSLLIIGLDKGKINIAVPVNFTRLKHVTDGQTIANFTDKDGYNLQLSVLSADDNLWTVYYYAPDGALISSYSFEFDPIW